MDPPTSASTDLPPEPEGRRAAILVWTVFALLLGGAVAYAAWSALPVPLHDDWDILRGTLPDGVPSMEWFWRLHNEHRITLAKLAHAGLDPIAGLDRRSTIAVNLLLLAGATALLLRAAGRARGRTSPADVILPVALLHPGHHIDFTWAFALVWVLVVVLFAAVLSVLAGGRSQRRRMDSWILGGATLGLSVSGVPGQILAGAVAAWIVASAFIGRRKVEETGIRCASPAFILAVAALAAIAGSIATFDAPAGSRLWPRWEALRTAAEYAGTATGPAYDLAGRIRGAGLIAVTVAACFLLARVARDDPARRVRLSGILAVGAGVIAIALAVGIGRGGEGPGAGGVPRYSHLASLILVAAHFAAIAAGRTSAARAVPWILGAILAAGLPVAATSAVAIAEDRLLDYAALERDVSAGAPIRVLARRHFEVVLLDPARTDLAGLLFYWLAMEHVGPFADPAYVPDLSEETFKEETLPKTPSWSPGVNWEGETGIAGAQDPQVHYFLAGARRVAGVRMTLMVTTGNGAKANLQTFWADSSRNTFTEERSTIFRIRSGERITLTVWIDDVIDQLRIDPDYRDCRFVLGDLVLLMPP